ncbi:hypothetical protein NHX12_032543 [Muraenolepis orangiensis]|uniref:Guanylate kinase-like domain-containing protein n=1 Tax=Muraenolepis orangiensis TaxID=630683 RepID=A0A9Q0E6I9_9TELE|nr:hypothetical protein NHX12_032543 [Muraenolepis orangiensis]
MSGIFPLFYQKRREQFLKSVPALSAWGEEYEQPHREKEGEEEEEEDEEAARPSSPWSEERCEELWERVEAVRHKLTRILNPAKLTPYLRQCKVIDEEDEDEFKRRLLDILRGQGPRGLQAFMESLEFYHPEQFTLLTGRQATQRCSLILDEEGPEGLTQFLLLEVKKLREQLRNTRLCERRLSQRCRVAEDERGRAERKAHDLRHDRLQLERLRHDWESGSRELAKLKDRHLEQAVKYSRALEEQGQASGRERELLRQVEELKSRLIEADKLGSSSPAGSLKRNSSLHNSIKRAPPPLLLKPLQCNDILKDLAASGARALMDILQQDRKEAAEQRQELCDTITRMQGELESTEEQMDKLEGQYEPLQQKVRTLQLDWETEQKRSVSYFNQTMELEKERDQALRSRDSLQMEYTDCLLDKNRLRKRITELQFSLEQHNRDLERERERGREQRDKTSTCLNCSHLSLCSEDQCYLPCCSLGLDLSPNVTASQPLLRKAHSRGQVREPSGESRSNSDDNLLSTEDNEKEINRLSTFPFPPCVGSINRRCDTEFDLDSWGSDENDNPSGAHSEPSLWDSWSSLHSHLFPPDLVNLPPALPPTPCSVSPGPPIPAKQARGSLADDITIVGGNQTGVFVSHCTSEVAHFSLQWWTEPSALKHRTNTEAYAALCSKLTSPSFLGADSFYVRLNLDMDSHEDAPCLVAHCDDIIHVTDTRYRGKYQWCCRLVDRCTAQPLKTGAMPNYNRAQQLLLVRLRTMALEQKNFRKKLLAKKSHGRVRLVKAVASDGRGVGMSTPVVYTLSNREEEQHLIPYSLVQPVQVEAKRPVLFSPSLLSRGLIERLLQPALSQLDFNSCPPEPIPATERHQKHVFMLNPSTPEDSLGIRLQSIKNVISQDKHCLLELSLASVEGLLRQGVYPLVIHIQPKNKKHWRLRKLFPLCGEEGVMEDLCRTEELQLDMLPLIYHTLEPSRWSSTDDLLAAIRSTIESQQRAVAWVELDRLQ